MNPEQILDRTEACQKLGISRQTLISWIRKGKLKVWKRVGHGTNAALLFERKHVESLGLNCRSGLGAPGSDSETNELLAADNSTLRR
jgi:hypothetical protein